MPWAIIIPAAILLLFTGFFGTFIPVVGVLWFTAFASWWWPFRSDSAATWAAAALDIDQETTEWREHGYDNDSLSNSALATTIVFDQFDGFSLTVDGQKAPLTPWDSFKLFWASARWELRHDRLLRKRADARAAAKSRDYLKRRATQSERTGA